MERQKKQNWLICAGVALAAIVTIALMRTTTAQDKPVQKPIRAESVRRPVKPVEQPKLIESNQGRNGLNANGGITINGNNNHIHVGDVITNPVERVIIREVVREVPRTEEPAKIVSVQSVGQTEPKRNPECDVRYREYEIRNQQWNALFR